MHVLPYNLLNTLLNNLYDIITEIQKRSDGKICQEIHCKCDWSCQTWRLPRWLVVVGNSKEALSETPLHRAKLLWMWTASQTLCSRRRSLWNQYSSEQWGWKSTNHIRMLWYRWQSTSSRLHRLMKTSSKQSKCHDLHLKWLHRETNNYTVS